MTIPIKRPMKALSEPITDEQLKQIRYPVYGSPKLDGIRALCTGTEVLSSSLKKIGNKYIQKCLSHEAYAGLDGELVVGVPYNEYEEEDDVFHRTSGAVRRSDGSPAFLFYVFDDFTAPHLSYQKRWLQNMEDINLDHVIVLQQWRLDTPQEVIAFETECIEQGYEGIMIRSPLTPYKEGRTTFKEQSIFKRKPILDDEAIIVACYEQMENLNEKVTNELGLSKRSGHAENKVGKATLGGFVCRSNLWKDTFNCGTIIGGTIALRDEIWRNQDKYIGRTIKYKYQAVGNIDKPRQPIMKGFRDPNDMTDY